VIPPKRVRFPWTGRLNFPCHWREPAFFEGSDVVNQAVQYWEQECPAWTCGRRWRFKRDGMWITVAEFHGPFTEPIPKQQTSPAPTFEVAWRIAVEEMEETA
jgi:hypothetical protein